jgi:hypothetical protein
MRSVLTVLIAVFLIAVISGCSDNAALTEITKIQNQQTAEIDKIIELVKQQNLEIIKLRKERKNKPAKTTGSSREKMIQAALVLAQNGPSNISQQAISILGYLGGEEAENALLSMVDSSSFSRNYSSITNALINMRSNKVRALLIKCLSSDDRNYKNAAMNILRNRSLRILKKSDLPMLKKILDGMSNNNYNNNRYNRNNLIGVICRLDQDAGVKYICDALGEMTDINQQRELLYILNNNRIKLRLSLLKKIIDAMGEPDNQNYSSFQVLFGIISNAGDPRLTDTVLPWADIVITNNNMKSQYINMLQRMRDPKAAKVMLDLCSSANTRNNHYLRNFPGIIKNGDKYQLVDDAAMKRLLGKREKLIARLDRRDKKRAAKK